MNKSCLFRLALAFCVSVLMAACTDTGPEGAASKENVVFHVEASYPTEKGATMTVSHNGAEDYRYYGFSYEDDGTSTEDAIGAAIEALKSAGADFPDVTFHGTSHTATVTGLMPNKDYVYVVVGLNDDYSVYGTSGTCRFSTTTGGAFFTIELAGGAAGETSATINVSSRYGEDATWYSFYTEDTETPASELLQGRIAEIKDDLAGNISKGDKAVELTGLEQGERYRFILSGLYEDGEVYGLPMEISFRTDRGDLPYRRNDKWTVTYDGKGMYTAEACEYVNTVSEDSQRYFMSIVKAETVDAGVDFDHGVSPAIADAIASLRQQIEMYNMQGYDVSWEDFSYTESAREAFGAISDAAEYYALAIGIDPDGSATGDYAISGKFSAVEEDATDAYRKWLGKWTITGSYLGEDGNRSDLSWDIVIEKVVNNFGYKVSGYGYEQTDEEEAAALPAFGVNFDKSTGDLLWNGSYAGQTYLGDDSGNVVSCLVYFAAVDGSDNVVTGDGFTIAKSTVSPDGQSADVVAMDITLEDGEVFHPVTMAYIAEITGSGQMSNVHDSADFPMTMKKTGEPDDTGELSVAAQSACTGRHLLRRNTIYSDYNPKLSRL